jgi:hypothetical protein
MRLLKRMRPHASDDCAAFSSRLLVMVARGRAELSCYDLRVEPVKSQGRQRLFWTPHELLGEDGGD